MLAKLAMVALPALALGAPHASQWTRTKCGSVSLEAALRHCAARLCRSLFRALLTRARVCPQPQGGADNTDIITQWGKKITPESVKTIFDYPRPQMVRSNFENLNGLWEFQSVTDGERPTFGVTLNETILVPFPVESCLSGLKDATDPNDVPPTYQHMWYRTTVSSERFQATAGGKTLLHFGAVDWQADVYVNGQWVGSNTGGYNGFSFDVTEALAGGGAEEIFVVVHDPSNMGPQPFGKQRISARYSPGGDTYTPVSGIWQTVWMESVPEAYIEGLKIVADMTTLTLTTNTNVPDGSAVTVKVMDEGKTVATSSGCKANMPCKIPISSPKLWSPETPFLYNMT